MHAPGPNVQGARRATKKIKRASKRPQWRLSSNDRDCPTTAKYSRGVDFQKPRVRWLLRLRWDEVGRRNCRHLMAGWKRRNKRHTSEWRQKKKFGSGGRGHTRAQRPANRPGLKKAGGRDRRHGPQSSSRVSQISKSKQEEKKKML